MIYNLLNYIIYLLRYRDFNLDKDKEALFDVAYLKQIT